MTALIGASKVCVPGLEGRRRYTALYGDPCDAFNITEDIEISREGKTPDLAPIA
jgi:hypothetical protein